MNWITDLEVVNTTENSFDLAINKHYAALVSRSKTISNLNQKFIKCFDKSQTFATFPISILVKNDSELITELNKIIRYAFEAGLVNLWRNRLVEDKMVKDLSIHPIQFAHITFLIYMMIFSLILCIIFFVIEVIVYKQFISTNNKFWTFCDKFIDGKRHY